MKNVPPKVGTEWRVNFYRLDAPPGGKPQIGSAWSPPMVGDFHAANRFGLIAFGDESGKVPGDAAKPAAKTDAPPAENAKPAPPPAKKASNGHLQRESTPVRATDIAKQAETIRQ